MPLNNYLKLAQRALQTEQGRAAARKAADGLAGAGNRLTHNKYADPIEKARAAINKQLGGPDDKGKGSKRRRWPGR
jgi:7-keto-8-aminopelargonate synthetase-like enzyme